MTASKPEEVETSAAEEWPEENVQRDLFERRNWGRWGEDDQLGALNLITAQQRLRALEAVRTGEALSLSRPVPTRLGSGNVNPSQHFLKMSHHGGDNSSPRETGAVGGSGTDYFGLPYHGVNTTHIDALSHVWDRDGMYNGRSSDEHYTFDGVTFGGIQHWSSGIFTRAVLLDVPAFRGTEYVDHDSPVHGWELDAIVERHGIEIAPGDAVCIYAGRERWQAAHPDEPYGSRRLDQPGTNGRTRYAKPGLHASCLSFLRKHDVSTLVWDMLDATPYEYDVTYTVHGAIHAYGMALVDNVVLEDLAQACRDRQQDDFLVVILPLVVEGGTGSPVNPIAVL